MAAALATISDYGRGFSDYGATMAATLATMVRPLRRWLGRRGSVLRWVYTDRRRFAVGSALRWVYADRRRFAVGFDCFAGVNCRRTRKNAWRTPRLLLNA